MTQRYRSFRKIVVGIVLFLLVAGAVLAAGETLPRDVVSSGGGYVAGNGLALRSVIGQPVAGRVGNGSLVLYSGFQAPPAGPAETSTATPTATATVTGTPTTPTTTSTATATPTSTTTPATPTPTSTAPLPASDQQIYLPGVMKE